MTKALTIEHLAAVATLVGLIKIATVARNVNRSRDVSSYNPTSTAMGVGTSLVWLLYDYHKGLKMGMATAGAALCLDLYILHLLLQGRRRKDKRG